MLSTYPSRTRAPGTVGRHAADEPEPAAVAPAPAWWRRLLPRSGDDVTVDGGQVVVRVRGALDDESAARLAHHLDGAHGLRMQQVVVVHLGACDFVDVRGLRALLQLQDQVVLHAGRMLVLDPPRTLRFMCAGIPGRLTLVPAEHVGPGSAGQA